VRESPFCAFGKSLEKRRRLRWRHRSKEEPLARCLCVVCAAEHVNTTSDAARVYWRKKRKIKILPLNTGEAWVAILFGHQQTTAPGSLHIVAKMD